ncbi:MAG: zinc ribbon domain-containing protein [Kiritimatiellia bacterium]
MITCPKCGSENPLGRVFCVSCGNKLDLSRMSSQNLAETQKVSWMQKHWRKLVLAAVVLVAGLIGIILWPRMGTLGEEGTAVGKNRVARGIGVIERLRTGQRARLEFSEKDINGMLRHKAEKMDLEGFSASLSNGACKVRMVKKLFTLPLVKFKWTAHMSYEILCYPWNGELFVAKGWVGHMRLPGPLKGIAEGRIRDVVSRTEEWKKIAGVAEMEISDDKLTVMIEK